MKDTWRYRERGDMILYRSVQVRRTLYTVRDIKSYLPHCYLARNFSPSRAGMKRARIARGRQKRGRRCCRERVLRFARSHRYVSVGYNLMAGLPCCMRVPISRGGNDIPLPTCGLRTHDGKRCWGDARVRNDARVKRERAPR